MPRLAPHHLGSSPRSKSPVRTMGAQPIVESHATRGFSKMPAVRAPGWKRQQYLVKYDHKLHQGVDKTGQLQALSPRRSRATRGYVSASPNRKSGTEPQSPQADEPAGDGTAEAADGPVPEQPKEEEEQEVLAATAPRQGSSGSRQPVHTAPSMRTKAVDTQLPESVRLGSSQRATAPAAYRGIGMLFAAAAPGQPGPGVLLLR